MLLPICEVDCFSLHIEKAGSAGCCLAGTVPDIVLLPDSLRAMNQVWRL
jgi:hypothetical protein